MKLCSTLFLPGVSIGAFQPQSMSSLARISLPRIPWRSRSSRSVTRPIFMSQGDDMEKQKGGNGMKPLVESLLSSTMERAMSTLSNNPPSTTASASASDSTNNNDQQYGSKRKISSRDVIDAAIVRATDQIENVPAQPNPAPDQKMKHEDKRIYLSNPAVTPTALGHSLWSQAIRPYRDTIIDATAGNGKDTLVLAEMLFPSDPNLQSLIDGLSSDEKPQLISIDIQQKACDNTLQLLQDNLDPDIVERYIQILHSSHAPMPELPKESVGLICYNLGYLPGADKEAFQTQMMTTIYSLADSALLIRPGGLLSVMTYPGNGWKEHCAVNYFMEGMAMFTTRDKGGWMGFIDGMPSDFELERRHIDTYGGDCKVVASKEEFNTRDTVRLALDRVKMDGFDKQTWRVFDHRSLGRPLSPTLFTGMRIK